MNFFNRWFGSRIYSLRKPNYDRNSADTIYVIWCIQQFCASPTV